MKRYFLVSVDHMMTTVEEVQGELSRVDYQARTDGIVIQYQILKTPKGNVKAWFERGVQEVMRHAKNFSKSGFVLWDKRSVKPYADNRKNKAIKAKMEKLL